MRIEGISVRRAGPGVNFMNPNGWSPRRRDFHSSTELFADNLHSWTSPISPRERLEQLTSIAFRDRHGHYGVEGRSVKCDELVHAAVIADTLGVFLSSICVPDRALPD